jgi:hypothetical protein
VTRDTRDQDFSANRQLFLTEQGYRYTIEDAEAAGLLVNGATAGSRGKSAARMKRARATTSRS